MKVRFVLCSALAGLICMTSALATDFTIDPAHSNVDFTIRHLVSQVRGSFERFTGSYVYDDKQKTIQQVKFVIEAASVNTSNAKRDNHLRSPDFFDVEKFPKIEFVSSDVLMVSKKMKVRGDLSIHGQTNPVVLDVEYLGMSPNAEGIQTAGFIARGKIKRSDFGITWNKTLDTGKVLLGDDVDLTINIEAGAANASATPAPKTPRKR